MPNAPAPIPSQYDEGGPMITLRKQLEQRAEEFRMVLPDHISPEKFQRTLLTAVQTNPDLMACDRRSFLTACMKAAQDGLLPDGREAAIVQFKTRVKDPQRGWQEVRLAQYLPMTAGLLKKIRQSGEIADIRVNLVYRQEVERGLFVYEEGAAQILRHKPLKAIDPTFVPTDADIALVYSVATFKDGERSFEVMARFEIDRVREASQTGARFDAKGEPRESKGPWVQWFSEMAKKTVLRRHAKTLPQSGDIVIRDVEAEDMGLAAAKSTMALLGSREADPPRQLPTSFDPETGELIDKRTLEDFRDQPEPEAAIVEPEINPPPPGPDPIDEAKARAEAANPDPEPDDQPVDLPTDELGVTRDDAKAVAESYIARAKACELLMDLRALAKEAELDLATMPEEFAACVDTAIDNARKRLTPPQKAKADS